MMLERRKRRFHRELENLQDRLMEMSGLAEELVRDAVTAFLDRDGSALKAIKKADRRIDALEVEIDHRVVTLIALHQPVASDLRRVLATLKISNDVERVGDHAHNIAKAARRLARQQPLRDVPELAEMAVLTGQMLGDALASLGSGDADLAREVCARDDRVDEMKAAVQTILTAVMQEDPGSVGAGLEYIRAAQQLERIGDLSTNISEEVVFLVEGRSIKHQPTDPSTGSG